MIRRLTFVVLCLGLAPLASAQPKPHDNQQLLYELLNRIELLEQELRQLRGEFETYQYQRDRQNGAGAGDDRLQALDRRLRALERAARTAAQPVEPPKKYSTTAPALDRPVIPPPEPEPNEEPPPADDSKASVADDHSEPPDKQPPMPTQPESTPASEEEAYHTAISRLREGRYEQAISGFQEFLSNNPGSPLVGNAQYWLGEAYYVTRDFDKSRQSFETLRERFPRNEKVPDALLKLGYIYAELGDKTKAREVLSKLAESYPNSKAAMQAQKQLRLLQ